MRNALLPDEEKQSVVRCGDSSEGNALLCAVAASLQTGLTHLTQHCYVERTLRPVGFGTGGRVDFGGGHRDL